MKTKKEKPFLTPWQRIMRSASRGTGMKLTAEEVAQLSMDGAIETRAQLDDQGVDDDGFTPTN